MAPRLLALLFAARVLASFAEMPEINALADLDRCKAADQLVTGCLTSPGFQDVPDLAQAQCLCCASGRPAAPIYGDCVSAIKGEDDLAPLFSAVSSVSKACVALPTTICRATSGSASATRTSTSRTTSRTSTSSRSSTITKAPAACTSFASLISSCSRKDPDFITQNGREQASCICYRDGTYNTRFDAYARTCASWAKTYSPGFSAPQTLTSFCAVRQPQSSSETSSTTGPPINTTPAPPPTSSPTTATVTIPFPSSTRPPNAASAVAVSSLGGAILFIMSVMFLL